MNIIDIVLVIFAALAALNLGVGCVLTIEKILKTFGRKGNIWMYVYIIVTSFGIVAIEILLKRS